MPGHDSSDLLDSYPEIIAAMADESTSHEFILKLAQKYQKLYIEALYAHRDVTHRGGHAPFRIVHGILSKRLHDFDELVAKAGTAHGSEDIFRNKQQCAKWRKHR
jgi:fructose-1,6-bisphosphatase